MSRPNFNIPWEVRLDSWGHSDWSSRRMPVFTISTQGVLYTLRNARRLWLLAPRRLELRAMPPGRSDEGILRYTIDGRRGHKRMRPPKLSKKGLVGPDGVQSTCTASLPVGAPSSTIGASQRRHHYHHQVKRFRADYVYLYSWYLRMLG